VKEGALDPKAEHAKPFWTELRKMEKGAAAIAADSKPRREGVRGDRRSRETLAALKVALHRTGVADAKVKEGVATLSHVYASLRKHYGKEALRRKKGGALTEKEQKSLAGLKEKESKLAVRWKALRDQAVAKGHKRVAAELDHLLVEAERIAKAEVTVEAYFIAFARVDVIEASGRRTPTTCLPTSARRGTKRKSSPRRTFAAFDASYAEEVDSIAVEDWSYLDEDSEVSSEIDFDVEVSDEEVAAKTPS